MRRSAIALALSALSVVSASLLIPVQAFALSGSLGGGGASSGGSGGGSNGSVAAWDVVVDKSLMRRWVFGTGSKPSNSNKTDYYKNPIEAHATASPAYIRGGDNNALDHWCVYLVKSLINDPQGNGVDDNTTKNANNSVEVMAWEPQPDGVDKGAASPKGHMWEEYWHDHYWSASGSRLGVPRPAKTDYGVNGYLNYDKRSTYTGSDPHVHQWFTASKNESHKLRGDEWTHSLVNQATAGGKRLITVRGNNGLINYPDSDPRDGNPSISVDTGVMAYDLTQPEGRYALFIIGVNGRERVTGATVATDIVRRPRIRVAPWLDSNGDGKPQASEYLPANSTLNYSLQLPKGDLGYTLQSPVVDGSVILGQDRNGNAIKDSAAKVVGKDVLYPSLVLRDSYSTNSKSVTLLDGSTKWTRTVPITQRGYNLTLDLSDEFAVQDWSWSRNYYSGTTEKSESLGKLGAAQLVNNDASKYLLGGATQLTSGGTTFICVDPKVPSKQVGAGLQLGISNGMYDGGIYTLTLQVKRKTQPLIGRVYYDQNQNGSREASEPLVPDETIHAFAASPVVPTSGSSISRTVDNDFKVSTLSVGRWSVSLTPGKSSYGFDWRLTTPASREVTIAVGDTPVVVEWGVFAPLSGTPKPQNWLKAPSKWLDSGRELTVRADAPTINTPLDLWVPAQYDMYEPAGEREWDWKYLNNDSQRMRYRVLRSQTSNPQKWREANANYGKSAATRFYWYGAKSYSSVSAAELERPVFVHDKTPAPWSMTEITAAPKRKGVYPKIALPPSQVALPRTDLAGGINYYAVVMYRHVARTWGVVDGEMVPSEKSTFEWSVDAANVKAFTSAMTQ